MQTAFLIYNFLYLVALLCLLPKEYFKRPAQLRKKWIREKFGFFQNFQTKKPKIWIHAVSVGEVIAVSRLIKELSKEYEILLSTITDTGQKVAKERFKECPVKVIYMPFDLPFAIKRTLEYFKPCAIILTETELWPNLIKIASQKIPVILVNGRLSERSFKGYSKIKFFIKPLLKKLSLICVQEENYRERFILLGADEKKIHLTGNMKFDIELKEIKFSWEDAIPRPVILAGSTHEQEEEIILDAFLNLNIPATLIIAPRHPERFSQVEELIRKKLKDFKKEIFFSRLSTIPSKFTHKSRISIILVDQIGILGSLYRICDIAIIGGSFIPHGGQNPLEAAYWKKPIISGPYMHNFPFIEEFLKEKASIMVEKDLLFNALQQLIKNPEVSKKIGEKAYEVFLKKSGATCKTVNLIKPLLLQFSPKV